MQNIVFVTSKKPRNSRFSNRMYGKKRSWLLKQIDPARRYLYKMDKEVKEHKSKFLRQLEELDFELHLGKDE